VTQPHGPQAAGPTAAGGRTFGLAGRDRWEWIRPVLTIASVVLPIGCALLASFDDEGHGGRALIGVGAAIAFAAWTVVMHRPIGAELGTCRWRLSFIYLVGAYLIFGVMVWTSPVYFFVLFVLYWQTFSLLDLKVAIPSAVVLAAGTVALQLRWSSPDRSITADPGILISGALSIAFGIFMAVWIGGIIDQSRQRGELIAELEATRAELAEVNHEAGVLAERERLAHEIHDTLAQGFTSIVMLAQAAERTSYDDPETARAQVRSIERTARDNLAEARNLVEGMGPAPLATDSLPDALRRLTDRLAGELGITATTEIQGVPHPLPSAVEVAILRAAQEALANVRKHARPRTVALTLCFGDEATVLHVTDDGDGFDVDARTADQEGFGLRGMRSRLEHVGGAVDVRSAVGHGTTVTVTLP
jgi:signal transduction histidine kinase